MLYTLLVIDDKYHLTKKWGIYMNLKKLSLVSIGVLGINLAAHANEVLLTANQPATIEFKVAHLNNNGQPVFEETQFRDISNNTSIAIDMNNYDLAGVVILSVNGHKLPPTANQFNQPEQCSMTTNKTNTSGTLEFRVAEHEFSCTTYGGVFG